MFECEHKPDPDDCLEDERRIAPCPYNEEIHGNLELCRCCDECRHQCAMDR